MDPAAQVDDCRDGVAQATSRLGVVFESRVFSVERVEVCDRDGVTRHRDLVRHPGAVTVVPILADGSLVLIRNHRFTLRRWMVEFCAGKLEGAEDPAGAALRELEEETGYRAGTIQALGAYYTSPGFCDELMRVFVATDLTPVPARLEIGEEIEVFTATRAQIRSMIVDGTMEDGKSIAAFAKFELMMPEDPVR